MTKRLILAAAAGVACMLFGAAMGRAQDAPAAAPQATLSWQDNSTNETAWQIQRAVDGGEFAAIAEIASGTVAEKGVRVQWLDTDLQPGHSYAYRVRAVNESGYSGYTNIALRSVAGPPNGDPSAAAAAIQGEPKPTLRIDVLDNGQVRISQL